MKAKVIENWYNAMYDVWSEIHKGRVPVEDIKLTKYQNKWGIGYAPRSLFLPYVTKQVAPSLEDAQKLHDEALAYYRFNYYQKHIKALKNPEDALTEEKCVEFLLNTGLYKIMKKDWVDVSAHQ